MRKKTQPDGVSAILGPFVTTPHEAEEERNDTLLQWGFIGILASNEVVHWTLTYSAARRSFSVSRSQSPLPWAVRRKLGAASAGAELRQGPPEKPWPACFSSLGAGVPMRGRIRDMLRSMLTPSEIARATSLSIQWSRRRP